MSLVKYLLFLFNLLCAVSICLCVNIIRVLKNVVTTVASILCGFEENNVGRVHFHMHRPCYVERESPSPRHGRGQERVFYGPCGLEFAFSSG